MSEASILEGAHGGLHVFFQRHVDGDTGGLELGEGPPAETTAENRLHGTGSKEVQGPASSVDMVFTPVSDRLDLLGFRVDEGKKGRATEVISRHALQPPVIHGWYAEPHGILIPFSRWVPTVRPRPLVL